MDKIEKVLREIERSGEKVFLPIIGRKKGAFLEKLIRKYKPKRILEIGTLLGYSAILMARNLDKGEIVSIEIISKIAESARKNIIKAGFENIEIIVGDALDVIPLLDGKFDFVFIDASKKEYFSYLELLERYGKIEKNCVIVADNAKIFANDMADYLEYVRESGNYKSEFYDFGNDGMEASMRL